jgi:predicted DNA binding protein
MSVRRQESAAEPVVEIELLLSDGTVPVIAAANAETCRFELEEFIPRAEQEHGEYYSVEGTDPETVTEMVDEHEAREARLLARRDHTGLVEVVVTDESPPMVLADHGALPRRVTVEDGEMTLSAEVPASHDASDAIAAFLEVYDDARLLARRQQSYHTPLFSHREFKDAIETALTERQRESLAVAHDAGYYAWPREVTCQELADELGVATPTYTEHLRTAEQKLLQLLFEDGAVHEADG